MSIGGKSVFGSLRVFFGIFMIMVYLGMAYLMIVNFFQWSDGTAWFRYLLAAVFGLYGFYRAYRQIKGLDYYRLHNRDNEMPQESEARQRTEQLIEQVKHDEALKSQPNQPDNNEIKE